MPANHKWMTFPGMAMLLLAGCTTSDETPGKRVGNMIVDQVTTDGQLRQVEYRDATTGDRYRLKASIDAKSRSGWIEARPANTADAVRIEWTPTKLQVTSNKADGTAQFWAMGQTRGLARLDLQRLQPTHGTSVFEKLPMLVQSATHADALLDAAELATPLALTQNLLAQQAPPTVHAFAAETFNCDNTIPLDDQCGVEAKMAKANKDPIFSVPSGWLTDKNSMALKCGDQDGLVRIQACPLSAYDCKTYPTAKTEQGLTVSEPSDDTTNNNQACRLLRAHGEGVDIGKKFDVKGLAEIRPGKAVRPKDPSDEAKSPSDCKLVWDLPEKADYLYNEQWGGDEAIDKTHTTKFEVSITAAAATGQLAIGGKAEINANVHTCQDVDNGKDDYAFVVRGTRANTLYNCSN